MNFTNIIIIYNPKSTGDSKQLAHSLRATLRTQIPKAKIELIPTRHAGHAETLALETSQRYKQPLIISSSGDGGYNEVVNGVMQSENKQVVCAVLPAGNANDHSRTMQDVPLEESIVAGKVTSIDLLKMVVNGPSEKIVERYAHSYIGLGITPVIAKDLNQQSLNALREIKIIIQRFYKYRPFEIRRGKRTLKLDSMLFANINQMAKVLTLAEKNMPSDGKFEVVSFPASKKRELISRLLHATVASLPTTRQEKAYSFETVKKIPVQLDGEVSTLEKSSKVSITSEHKALRTVV